MIMLICSGSVNVEKQPLHNTVQLDIEDAILPLWINFKTFLWYVLNNLLRWAGAALTQEVPQNEKWGVVIQIVTLTSAIVWTVRLLSWRHPSWRVWNSPAQSTLLIYIPAMSLLEVFLSLLLHFLLSYFSMCYAVQWCLCYVTSPSAWLKWFHLKSNGRVTCQVGVYSEPCIFSLNEQ